MRRSLRTQNSWHKVCFQLFVFVSRTVPLTTWQREKIPAAGPTMAALSQTVCSAWSSTHRGSYDFWVDRGSAHMSSASSPLRGDEGCRERTLPVGSPSNPIYIYVNRWGGGLWTSGKIVKFCLSSFMELLKLINFGADEDILMTNRNNKVHPWVHQENGPNWGA